MCTRAEKFPQQYKESSTLIDTWQNALAGSDASVGDWARIEGTPNDPNPDKPFAKMECPGLFNEEGRLNPAVTILGEYIFEET